MDDVGRQPGAEHAPDVHDDIPTTPPETPEKSSQKDGGAADFDDSILREVTALIDDGRNYAQAEIAFQKTRAKLAGKSVGVALACVVVALILLNIAFLALAVGLVIALAPLVTIWGAIAIVVGALLLIAGLLGYMAMKQGVKLSALFSDESGGENA